ncbi:MAG: hypothetical protein JWN48_1861 [Myxococcaceae bacterium]|nr:hypothetical protein [Myxococcaceae bacterium]
MAPATYVTSRDIEAWADRLAAQSQLPSLLRRLVHATTTTATHVGFPAEESVQMGGWDGVVIIDEDHQWVPHGLSVWELGTSRKVTSKANDDYRKRSAAQPSSGAGHVDLGAATFVFVTPRRWAEKENWIRARQEECRWKRVVAYDADDLEQWLEQSIPTHAWLSLLLGLRPEGVDDVEAAWLDWSQSTRPELSVGFMFAGRAEQQVALTRWISGADTRPVLTVAAESREEVIALVAAAAQGLPADQRVAALSRTIIVRSKEALAKLASSQHALSMIVGFPVGDLAQRATRAGHRVLIAIAPSEATSATVKLERLSRSAVEHALSEMGVPSARVRELALVARRSLQSLRRRLATHDAIQQPAWATPQDGPLLVPMLLLGQFVETGEGDREVLGRATGSADDALGLLMRWSTESDPPVRCVGDVWYVVSKEDAWDRLARYLSREAIERFETIAVDVLTEVDPRQDLAPAQYWVAGFLGKRRRYSEVLRRGLADSLAMLGSRGQSSHVAGGDTAASVAARIVCEVLAKANQEPTLWASLSNYLPSLATR